MIVPGTVAVCHKKVAATGIAKGSLDGCNTGSNVNNEAMRMEVDEELEGYWNKSICSKTKFALGALDNLRC